MNYDEQFTGQVEMIVNIFFLKDELGGKKIVLLCIKFLSRSFYIYLGNMHEPLLYMYWLDNCQIYW